jgi:tetratricopeptide (TPR) repeat protein
MTTLIIDGLNRNVLKKRSIVTLKWEDDPEKRLGLVVPFEGRSGKGRPGAREGIGVGNDTRSLMPSAVKLGVEAAIECLRTALRVAPDYVDAMFNLALLLQRTNQYAEAAGYWRRYLAGDCQSEWAARARRSLKFCEIQINLIASA